MGRFRSRIHVWDVINEAHDWANDLNLDQQQLVEITRLAAETTRAADPTAFRVVNNCCTWGEYVATRRSYSGPLNRAARTPFEYLQAVEAAHVPYEAIGLQVYYPARDMLEIERQLERFFVFGKPVHITELGVSSSSEPTQGGEVRNPNRNVWHGAAWSEHIQADWAEQFYTICYSKPQIQAITWWDFADPAFIPHGGFLDANLRPKPVYERLRRCWPPGAMVHSSSRQAPPLFLRWSHRQHEQWPRSSLSQKTDKSDPECPRISSNYYIERLQLG